MNTSGLLQSEREARREGREDFTLTLQETRSIHDSTSGFTLALQETHSIHDSMKRPKILVIAYIHISL